MDMKERMKETIFFPGAGLRYCENAPTPHPPDVPEVRISGSRKYQLLGHLRRGGVNAVATPGPLFGVPFRPLKFATRCPGGYATAAPDTANKISRREVQNYLNWGAPGPTRSLIELLVRKTI